jgi:hypothetical protein
MGFLPLALVAPEPREARRRAKLPGAGLLGARDRERTLERCFGFRRIRLRRPQCDFTGHAMDVGFPPPFLGFFHRRDRLVNAAPSIVEMANVGIGRR